MDRQAVPVKVQAAHTAPWLWAPRHPSLPPTLEHRTHKQNSWGTWLDGILARALERSTQQS